jgi:hypothetical protein
MRADESSLVVMNVLSTVLGWIALVIHYVHYQVTSKDSTTAQLAVRELGSGSGSVPGEDCDDYGAPFWLGFAATVLAFFVTWFGYADTNPFEDCCGRVDGRTKGAKNNRNMGLLIMGLSILLSAVAFVLEFR